MISGDRIANGRLPLRVKAGIVAEVVLTYARITVLLRRREIAAVLADLRADAPAAATDPASALRLGRRLAKPVLRTLTPLPGDTRCLTRSLVLLRLLARRGVATTLIIGARPGDRFEAHAWIEYDGRPLLPTEQFHPLTVL